MKKIIIFCILISFVSRSQTDTAKNVIIINTNIRSIPSRNVRMIINGIETPRIVYKSFIVQQHYTDSIEIKIPYRNLLLKDKEKVFHFAIKDKNNYFKYVYSNTRIRALPDIKQITGKKLIRLKKRRYIREKIAEFYLEE